MSAQLNAIKTLTATLTKSEVKALHAYLCKQIEPVAQKKGKINKPSPYAAVAPLY